MSVMFQCELYFTVKFYLNVIIMTSTFFCCAACVHLFHCTGSHCAAVVCNLMAGSCKMISKQTAKSPSSSSSSSLSLPLSPVISIFHSLFLSILSTLLQLCLPNFHLTHFLSPQSSHTQSKRPPFLLSVHPDICVAGGVYTWAAGCSVHVWLVGEWRCFMSFLLNTHLSQLSEHTKSRKTD